MNALLKKIVYCCFAAYFVLSLIGGAILQSRLEHSMERCEQYRVELELAQNRESEIGECISRTNTILSQTSNTVAGLREKLKAVEDSYNYMWKLLCNDSNNIDNEGD